MAGRFILASASPNRLELLKSIFLEPDLVQPADVDETPLKGEAPKNYVLRVATDKAQRIAADFSDDYVLAADTIAATSRAIIGKAEDEEEARKTIQFLSGRRHSALTGVCLVTPQGKVITKRVETVVKFKPLMAEEIERYIASGAWQGKAGCYGLQSAGGGFVHWIRGSYSNVIGLPLVEVQNLLVGNGYRR